MEKAGIVELDFEKISFVKNGQSPLQETVHFYFTNLQLFLSYRLLNHQSFFFYLCTNQDP